MQLCTIKVVLKPSPFKVEITTEKLTRYKSPSTDQILAEIIQARGNHCYSVWNKEELSQQ